MNLEMRLTPESVRIVILLHVVFACEKKVYQWLVTKNMNFGNLSPLYLINRGRGMRVIEFIRDAERPEEINGVQRQRTRKKD